MIRLFFLIFALGLSSCSSVITYEPDYTDKIVINASISPQNGVDVRLSKSVSPSSSAFYSIEDLRLSSATVKLYKNDSLVTLLGEVSAGRYRATNLTIAADEVYHLEVSAANYPDAFTQKVTIPKALTGVSYFFEFLGNNEGKITTYFNNGTTLNFYAQEFYGFDSLGQKLHLSTFLPQYEGEGICEIAYSPTHYIFQPDCFSEGRNDIELGVRYLNKAGVINTPDRSSVKKIILKIKNVDEGLFKYTSTYSFQGSFFESVGTEAPTNYSNVINGYGLFVAENVRNFEIEL